MVDRQIHFQFENRNYIVDHKAYDKERVILPDGRVLEIHGWKEAEPPTPIELVEIFHPTVTLVPDVVARLAEIYDAAKAYEVTLQNFEREPE